MGEDASQPIIRDVKHPPASAVKALRYIAAAIDETKKLDGTEDIVRALIFAGNRFFAVPAPVPVDWCRDAVSTAPSPAEDH